MEGDDIGMLRSNFAGDVAAVAARRAELERIAVGESAELRERLEVYRVLATEPWRDADGYEIGRLPQNEKGVSTFSSTNDQKDWSPTRHEATSTVDGAAAGAPPAKRADDRTDGGAMMAPMVRDRARRT